ncbi:arginine--tRNA ligase [Hujiaoplasma nucleasis]|uniref:Arginine--tRNA ligase n=1 Tax=Hujiaoplasma nucleasis TaxID=2725268 RepID=A0A7L6MZQ2_9MOLU|nr:arginine--tRNA ligase [Hujiaoplasma nucleasis]QLY39476.1 arginine--tRNA ligase [Hujiaoplasma nucleasis]
MINQIKESIKSELEFFIYNEFQTKIEIGVEKPKNPNLGDLSVPVFSVVKALRRPLPEIVKIIQDQLQLLTISSFLAEINSVSGFINIRLNQVYFAQAVIKEYQSAKNYGESLIGLGKTIVIDYSSPNIAKPFSVGHLRSTVIGNAIGNILEKLNYKVVRINHLGDFGTQFGKIIYAYLNFGDKEKVDKNPIEELMKLYVDFHELAKENPEIEDKAREIFKELELNNPEYVSLWKHFRQVSLEEYMKVYKILGVEFDSYDGEAFYNDKMQTIVDELKEKNLLVKDQGAMIVSLDDDLPPALIQKSDGSTLYITRDLAALFYRKNTYHFDEVLYVVGNEQKLHFTQLQEVVKKMGYSFYEDIHHINFGLVLQDGKKMSTRKGKIVKLIDVLEEARNLSLNYMNEKNPSLENKEEIAQAVGVSAIIFNDLKNFRSNDIDFNLEDMVNFVGQTGPYLQYTSVRISSILDENIMDINSIDFDLYANEASFELIKSIDEYQDILLKAKEDYAPSVLAKYLLSLASYFNSYYAKEKVMVDDLLERNTKLYLISIVRHILNDGMKLLGMKIIKKM